MRIALAVALLAAASAGVSVASPPAPVVPRGQLLVSDRDGRLLVVDMSGRVRRRLPFTRSGCCPGQVELAGDRRHAFLGESRNEHFRLLEVDLATGRSVRVAAGGSPAVSPDGRRLAYYAVSTDVDVPYRTAVIVRDLGTGRSRRIPFAERAVWGNPADVMLNWSPDSRKLAVVGSNRRTGGVLYVVDVAQARTIETQPSMGHLLAPAFLDDSTILGLANCCIGTHQQMVAMRLGSRGQKLFATLPEPPESLRRIAPGTFVATTPDGFLLRFSKGRMKRLGTGRYFSVSG